MAGERILFRAKVSSTVFIGPIVLGLIGVCTAQVLRVTWAVPDAIVAVLIGLATACFICFILLFIVFMTAEVAVTDRRVIGKVGWVWTRSVDLLLTKVESVSINRGIFGLLYDYGTVTISGTGQTSVPFLGIDEPEEFRRVFLKAVEAAGTTVAVAVAPPSGPAAALFEVQIVDRQSGEETWIPIRAATSEEAIELAVRTGAMVGKCKLKSIG